MNYVNSDFKHRDRRRLKFSRGERGILIIIMLASLAGAAITAALMVGLLP